ncbi:ribonuclease BN [Acidianus brierleyi]|uniref:Ribonuclease BN n=1 Tax=Acidianus brierleyi TaxID=41673 RepID=A0A2U9IEL5_9CREN|nr:ribonuclease BN [Acidianus brierleyi]AWR94449.1 ribonuclease BN [Acidianus brierleyi]
MDIDEIIKKFQIDLDIDEIIDYVKKNYDKDKLIWDKIVVYIDLKNKGKRISLSKSQDFIFIEKKNSNEHGSLVYVLTENQPILVSDLEKIVKLSKSLRVDVYLSIVDKYGDITYYNVDETKLTKG